MSGCKGASSGARGGSLWDPGARVGRGGGLGGVVSCGLEHMYINISTIYVCIYIYR